MMKRLLCAVTLLTSLILQAQDASTQLTITEGKGIKWTTGLSWPQILEKAKVENKYIFLDCYTTWCGPCKMMDKEVYSNDSVGELFNEKFISLKLQMDQTSKDDDYVKTWYQYANDISTRYFVYSYPTYLFFSPDDKPVHKETGYRPPVDFIALARAALEPGRAYIDPAVECARLVEEWEKEENKDYDLLPKMIKMARSAYNQEAEIKLLKELGTYMTSLPKEDRYTKERVEIWKDITFTTTSKTMSTFFLKDGQIVDRVMNEKGFSARIVDKAIFTEICVPFLIAQNKNKKLPMSGMYLGGSGTKDLKDTSEADWNRLEKEIKQKFNKQVAERNVLSARIEWYKRHFNDEALFTYSLLQFKKYPPSEKKKPSVINEIGWSAFLQINDKKILTEVTACVEQVAEKSPTHYLLLDTYANLLYKLGRREDAIAWEQKAIGVAHSSVLEDYKMNLEQMKRGEPTNKIKPLWIK